MFQVRQLTRILRAGSLALVASSCAAHRYLTVTSEPTGAAVEIDGQKLGYTPFELEFQHYGVRQISVAFPGHTTWTQSVRVTAPWYGRFPLDLVSEILLPIGWVDRHEVHAVLEPHVGDVADPDLQAVLARARALRSVMESPTDARPPPSTGEAASGDEDDRP